VEYLRPYMITEHDGTLEIHPLWDYGIVKPVSVEMEMEMDSKRWNIFENFL
jgi:hypothetical protein